MFFPNLELGGLARDTHKARPNQIPGVAVLSVSDYHSVCRHPVQAPATARFQWIGWRRCPFASVQNELDQTGQLSVDCRHERPGRVITT